MAESLLRTMSRGSAEWYRQKAFEDGERDWNSRMYGAEQKGITIGAQQATRENARKLLALEVLPETIAQGCSLPLEEVLALKGELERES